MSDTAWLCSARPADGRACGRCGRLDPPGDVLIRVGEDWLCEPCLRAELRLADSIMDRLQ